MKFLILILTFFSFPLFAEEERWHMISFGRDGLGWSTTREGMDAKRDSPFRSVDYFLNDLALNYAFRINKRIQLGAFYENSHNDYTFKKRGGGESESTIEINTTGFFSLYNFSEDLNDAWYAGLSFALTSYEEENSKDLQQSEAKGPFELDDVTETFELIVGKRFSLRGFNVDNLAFSPQLRVFYRTHGKDFDDQDVGDGTGVNLQPIRFDLLF